jgi:hypothetical protein
MIVVRCNRCNHRIWVKESVERGMGPVCAEKDTTDKLVWHFNKAKFDLQRKEFKNEEQSDMSKLRSDFLKSQKSKSLWFSVPSS